jgi:hypothetical protein
MIATVAVFGLVLLGWAIWKAPPYLRVACAVVAIVVVARAASSLARTTERNRIQTTYFRGLNMVFSDLDDLAKATNSTQLALKVELLNREFSGTTPTNVIAFNALMDKLLNPIDNAKN